MSYILEALKKAQAERQLGNAPTIHAPQAAPVAPAGAAASRKPLFIGLGAGALVVAAGAVFLWRAAPVQAPAGQVAALPAVTGAAAGSPATVSAPAASPAAAAFVATAPAPTAPAASSTLEVSAPPPPPRAEAPRVAQARPPAPAAHGPAHVPAAALAAAAPTPVPTPVPAQAASAPARTPAPVPAPEDSLPFLQQLPEAVQREVPRVAFGGYMYSANPADRLLLVDKSLRHEGEEVAPGLVLEKLLPRAAVMNYRGMRYRVGL